MMPIMLLLLMIFSISSIVSLIHCSACSVTLITEILCTACYRLCPACSAAQRQTTCYKFASGFLEVISIHFYAYASAQELYIHQKCALVLFSLQDAFRPLKRAPFDP